MNAKHTEKKGEPKVQHTPTPWSARLSIDGTECYEIRKGPYQIASLYTPQNLDKAKANAEFIVEAVNAFERLTKENEKLKADNAALLEAVKVAYSRLPNTASPQEFLNGTGNWGLTREEYEDAQTYAKAIAQAEGDR